MDVEFESQFVGDASLTPGWILTGHEADQGADIVGQRRSAKFVFVTPECAEDVLVPLEKGRGLDDHECIAPVEESGGGNHDQPESGCRAAWLVLAFDIEGELFAKEEVFSEE